MSREWICPECQFHTNQAVTNYGRGEYKLTCLDCKTQSPLYDADGNVMDEKKFRQEIEDWN